MIAPPARAAPSSLAITAATRAAAGTGVGGSSMFFWTSTSRSADAIGREDIVSEQ